MTKLDVEDLDQYPIARLLIGYALENIFRGIIITKMWLDDPKSVDIADFEELRVPDKGGAQTMRIMEVGHHLSGLLAARAMTIQFTDAEKDMMDTLEDFIVWAGRYATSKKCDPIDPHGLKRFEPIEYTHQTVDSLYQKAMEELIRLCRLQGDKLSE
jgi:hypothetical protein